MTTWRPRLIVTDIDGTLIDSHDRVPHRVRDAISRAVDSGCEVALATGRPYRWISMVLDQLTIQPVCVTSNGAVVYDSARDHVISAHELQPTAMGEIVAVAKQVFAPRGGVAIAAERVPASADAPEEEAFIIVPEYVHTWAEQGFGVGTEDEVMSQPALKLMLRNVDMTSAQMYDVLAPHIDSDKAHITYSISEGLLEVAAPGVTKAAGISHLARLHDVSRDDVVAFGDMPNDIEMLQWARLGVAVGNAADAVKEAADEVTSTNNEGGLAEIIERWF